MDPLIIPIVAMLIPIVVVPVALFFKHARLVREFEHAERMKAMEVGRTLPQDEPWFSPARICVAIGVGVPIGVFLCAWFASAAVGYHEEMWHVATAVGLAGVICGSILASRHFAQHGHAEGQTAYPKPMLDADAFDVVGRRG